jgi:hypothetical protein
MKYPPTFADVLAEWYGPQWRRIAPAALGRSSRTIRRWAIDDKCVPRWAWQLFSSERTHEKWREIDQQAATEHAGIDQAHASIDQAASEHKSAVLVAGRAVDERLRLTEFQPPPRVGRPPKHPVPRPYDGAAPRLTEGRKRRPAAERPVRWLLDKPLADQEGEKRAKRRR